MAVTEPSTDTERVLTRPNAPETAASRGRRLLTASAPGLIFLGIRGVGLLTLAWLVEVNGGRVLSKLAVWDGQWLLSIASAGYDHVPAGLVDAFGHRDANTPLAFFPGYPAAVAIFRFITGTDLIIAGLAVSLLSSLVLAYGLARLGELVPGGSRRVGLLLVALVAAAPMGVVWSMTYTEALFCACAVWALVAVLRRHWLLAGWCTALAGAVRPTAAALLGAVGLAALIAVLAEPRDWRAWLGGLLAPFGLIGYLGFVASRTGSPNGWFNLQERGWNSRFDGGAATLEFTREILASGRSVLEVGTILVLLGALTLLAICVGQRLPWPLVVYSGGVLLMAIGSNGLMNSKARLVLPAFTLFVPVALALARRRPATALLVVGGATMASAWFGGYAITVWPYAI